MSKDAKVGISLAKFDTIFNDGHLQSGESVRSIALAELFAPDPHPFMVLDDEAMTKLAESIHDYGVREPGLARPLAGGGYELLCGNRRKRACEIAGLIEMPVIVRELDDNAAVLAMIDSNLQSREKILPSEKAWAYRYRMEALNHNGVKAEQNSCDVMAAQTGVCKTQIFKTIRLTELIDALLNKVDAGALAFSPAVELSYLSYDEQQVVADCMERYAIKPSLSQAVKLKKLKQAGTLTAAGIDDVLSNCKKSAKPVADKSVEAQLPGRFLRFFPAGYSAGQMSDVIEKLLTEWRERLAV